MPFRKDWFTTIQQEMDRLLDDFSRRKPPAHQFRLRGWEPSVDVHETDTDVVVLIELAGVNKDEVELAVDRRTLRIRGNRKEGLHSSKRSCHRLEIYWGPFERVVPLPAEIAPETTKATFKDGLLEVVLTRVRVQPVRLMVQEV